MKNALVALLAVALTAVLTACPRHHIRPPHHGPPGHGKVKVKVHHHGPAVVIKKTHLHSAHCGHYRHKGKWHHHHGHVHGHRCGHVLRRGIWVFVD